MVAVMTEPLACAMHGADVLRLGPGSDVLVFGAGPTGLLLTQLLGTGEGARDGRRSVRAQARAGPALRRRRGGAHRPRRPGSRDPVARGDRSVRLRRGGRGDQLGHAAGGMPGAHHGRGAVLALRSGRVRTDGIVTDLVGLEDHAAALEAVRSLRA